MGKRLAEAYVWEEEIGIGSALDQEYFKWKAMVKKLAVEAREYYKVHGIPISKYLAYVLRIAGRPQPSLSSCLDIQLAAFLKDITLGRDDQGYRERIVFIEELQELLRMEFPDTEVHAFGSFLTGLGDKFSDIDLYVNLHYGRRDLGGGPQWVKSVGELDQLYDVCKIVRESGLYTNIEEIILTRVPIIRLEHKKTGFKCDLSFKSLLSTQNSKLILLYTQLDPRIGTLMRIVRYWGKFHGFCGSLKIKTYAFNLMVLFFFMKKKFIPTVRQLQTIAEVDLRKVGIATLDEMGYSLVPLGGTKQMIAGWNGGFLDDPNLIRQFMGKYKKGGFRPWKKGNEFVQDTSLPVPATEILKLLQEFMEFYAKVDYYNMVISPFNGELMPKFAFSATALNELPRSFRLYKERFKGMGCSDPAIGRVELKIWPQMLCIVDPFILNFNVGQCAKPIDIENWQYSCKMTANAIKRLLAAAAMEKGGEGKFGDIFFQIDFIGELGTDEEREDARAKKLEQAQIKIDKQRLEFTSKAAAAAVGENVDKVKKIRYTELVENGVDQNEEQNEVNNEEVGAGIERGHGAAGSEPKQDDIHDNEKENEDPENPDEPDVTSDPDFYSVV